MRDDETTGGCAPALRNRRAIAVLGRLLLITMLGVGCTQTPTEEARPREISEEQSHIIRIGGSSTVLPIAAKAAERFMEIHPGMKVTVNAGGSGVGIKSVGAGLADIGMISRDITDEEAAQYRAVDLQVHVVGKDAVTCVVSSRIYEAGVRRLSRQAIRKIYAGEIKNWRMVGGPDEAIVVVDKEIHRGTRHVFMEFVFGDERAVARGAAVVAGSNNEIQTKIALSETAIGMLSLAWTNDRVRAIGIDLGDETIFPTLDNVRNGSYPIIRDLSLVTVGEPTGLIREYIDFILSPEGQRMVAESGYVPAR